ncbi:cytochrome c oxidase assembly protein [Cellulomonas sp. Marseille-Q8402]
MLPAHAGHPGHGAGTSRLTGWELLDVAVALALVGAAAGYVAALVLARSRTPWPVRRTVLWLLGLACVGAALLGPLATAARTSFTAHAAGHLLLGMLGPLLLVLGAPVTLALRALPVTGARSLVRLLRAPPVRVVTHPVVAGTLDAGGLWLLYGTDLFARMHASPALHGLVHLHVLVAGYLFTASVVGRDPDPHRASVQLRSAALIVFIAAHAVLAKWLYAHPPAGADQADARVGAQLMYYGGDAVDVTLVVLLLAGWYAATRPRPAGLAASGAAAP